MFRKIGDIQLRTFKTPVLLLVMFYVLSAIGLAFDCELYFSRLGNRPFSVWGWVELIPACLLYEPLFIFLWLSTLAANLFGV